MVEAGKRTVPGQQRPVKLLNTVNATTNNRIYVTCFTSFSKRHVCPTHPGFTRHNSRLDILRWFHKVPLTFLSGIQQLIDMLQKKEKKR